MTEAGRTGGTTVGSLLDDRAAERPDERFIWCGGEWLTYEEAARASDGLAAALQRRGVRAGDRVAVILPNTMVAVLMVYACARLGAIQVPLNTFLRGEFLRHQLHDCEASIAVTDRLGLAQVAGLVGQQPDLREVIVVDEDEAAVPPFPLPLTRFADLDFDTAGTSFPVVAAEDIFSILYTSGTTGLPKGCLMSHRYATHIAAALTETGRFVERDAVLTASPLFHTSGQIFAMMSALHVGGSIAFEREFHASTFMDRARELGSTAIFGVGAVGLLLLTQPARDSDRDHGVQRAVMNGMPAEAQLELERRFGFHVIGEMYGQTEFVPVGASPVAGPRNRSSAGRILPHVEARVVDDEDRQLPVGRVGEIVLRPRRPGVMFDGYWNNAAATLETWRGLWHHTGDFGRFDEQGFLHFVDRKKDAIRRRGEFVSSRELEAAILTNPDIGTVAVHAVSSELTEDEIRCWIVPQPGVELSAGALFEFFKAELPYFAIPRYVDVVDQLPTNQTARVMKHELKSRPMTSSTWDLQALGLTVARSERRGTVPAG